MITCDILRRHVDAIVDGEVDPTTELELEEHLDACEACREHLELAHAFKRQVAEALGDSRAPAGLRERLLGALDAEDAQRSPTAVVAARTPVGLTAARLPFVRPRYAVPAAAAAVALAVIASREQWGNLSADEASPEGVPTAASAADASSIFEDVFDRHSVDHPAEVRGPEAQVANWFRGKLEFPVHPIHFDRADAHLVGARLSRVQDRDAATFYYDVHGRRVTVMVFEPSAPVERVAQRAEVGGHSVYYGRAHGHTVPVVEHDGLTYAIAGNLDSRSLLQLAASASVRDP